MTSSVQQSISDGDQEVQIAMLPHRLSYMIRAMSVWLSRDENYAEVACSFENLVAFVIG